jgi:hypothetical protein
MGRSDRTRCANKSSSPTDRDRADARSDSRLTLLGKCCPSCHAYACASSAAVVRATRVCRSNPINAPGVGLFRRKNQPELSLHDTARKPRTECGCQPVVRTIAAIVVPSLDRNILRMRACLVTSPRELAALGGPFFVLGLSDLLFGDLTRELEFTSDFAMRTSEVGDTSVAPPQPAKASRPRGQIHKRSPAASSSISNAPVISEVQRNMSNFVAGSALGARNFGGEGGRVQLFVPRV